MFNISSGAVAIVTSDHVHRRYISPDSVDVYKSTSMHVYMYMYRNFQQAVEHSLMHVMSMHWL